MGHIELLEWDSEFFGFTVGRVELDGATPERLQQIEAEAFDLGITCLYGVLDPVDTAAAQLAQTYGHRLVDVALTFRSVDRSLPERTVEARVREGSADDLPHLDGPLSVLVPWSRFGADPRFGPEAARRVLDAWVERALRDDDRALLVAEDDTGIIGLATCVRSPVPRCDLMGVTRQRSGAAHAFMSYVFDWAGSGELLAGPCMARNAGVLAYVEYCGFRVCKSEYRYHWWADEQPKGTR